MVFFKLISSHRIPSMKSNAFLVFVRERIFKSKKMHKSKIVAVGLYSKYTGMGRVLRQFANKWKEEYKIHYLALGCHQRHAFEEEGVSYYPVSHYSVRCPRYTAILCQKVQPDLVFLSVELEMLPAFVLGLKHLYNQTKLLAYIPIEGHMVSHSIAQFFNFFDQLVVFTNFAKSEIKRSAKVFQATNALELPPVSVIGHGVDCQIFYPLDRTLNFKANTLYKQKIRRRLFPNHPKLLDSFLILNPNLPYERKRQDLTIKGFAQFLKKTSANAYLILHHSRVIEDKRKALLELAKAEQIADRVIFSPIDPSKKMNSVEFNQLYNACDVGINTAMGEGWGLTCFEHAACGVPQLVPKHTSFIENWSEDSVCFLEVEAQIRCEFPAYLMNAVSVESISEQLTKLYLDKSYYEKIATNGYNWVKKEQFNWKNVNRQWKSLFDNLFFSKKMAIPSEI